MDSGIQVKYPGPLFRNINDPAQETGIEAATLSVPQTQNTPDRSRHEWETAVSSAAVPPMTIPESPIPAVNVAQVPQRSPLRYPGGKTWLIPHIRAWLGGLPPPQSPH